MQSTFRGTFACLRSTYVRHQWFVMHLQMQLLALKATVATEHALHSIAIYGIDRSCTTCIEQRSRAQACEFEQPRQPATYLRHLRGGRSPICLQYTVP